MKQSYEIENKLNIHIRYMREFWTYAALSYYSICLKLLTLFGRILWSVWLSLRSATLKLGVMSAMLMDLSMSTTNLPSGCTYSVTKREEGRKEKRNVSNKRFSLELKSLIHQNFIWQLFREDFTNILKQFPKIHFWNNNSIQHLTRFTPISNKQRMFGWMRNWKSNLTGSKPSLAKMSVFFSLQISSKISFPLFLYWLTYKDFWK